MSRWESRFPFNKIDNACVYQIDGGRFLSKGHDKFHVLMAEAPYSSCPWSCVWFTGQFLPLTMGVTQYFLVRYRQTYQQHLTKLVSEEKSAQLRHDKVQMLPRIFRLLLFYRRGMWWIHVSRFVLVRRGIFLQQLRCVSIPHLCHGQVSPLCWSLRLSSDPIQ